MTTLVPRKTAEERTVGRQSISKVNPIKEIAWKHRSIVKRFNFNDGTVQVEPPGPETRAVLATPVARWRSDMWRRSKAAAVQAIKL